MAVMLCFLGMSLSCKRKSDATKEVKVSHTGVVEIVPGRSIGEVRLGRKVDALPSQAVITRPSGVLNGIRFLIGKADTVEDVWIEDIRSFPHDLQFRGKSIPRNASMEDLHVLLGKCERVSGVKGGIFYNCAAGVALGTDFSRKTLQLRVKPLSLGAGSD